MRASFNRVSNIFRSYIKLTPLVLAAPAFVHTSNDSFKTQFEEKELSQDTLDKVLNTVKSTYNNPIIALNYTMMRDPNAPNMLFLNKYIQEMKSSIINKNELNLLDIGCGTGATMSKVIESIFDENLSLNLQQCNITGIDIANTMLKVAEQHLDFTINQKYKNDISSNRNNIKIDYKLIEGDMRDLCKLVDGKQGLYDGIVSFYAIIHVPRQDHESILKQCWNLLNDDGLLCICVGAEDLKLDYDKWDGQPMYWSQWDMQTSLQLVQYCNFKILEHKFIRDTTSDDPQCGHLFILAKKKQIST